MARQLRVEYPGAIYHVTVRMLGDWKRQENRLFEDDHDRERFLSRLADRVEQYEVRLYLFCLMANHVHLAVETPKGNLGRFMQALTTAYTVYFNLRHGRHGHLVDGRYKAKVVEGDDYLLALSSYIHLNPVQAEPIKDRTNAERIRYLREYAWSSYPSYIGRRRALPFVEYGPILSEMGGKRRKWSKRYQDYVESGLTEPDEDFIAALKESPRCIGSDAFRVWVDELYEKRMERHGRLEDIAFRRITEPLKADLVLRVLSEVMKIESGAFRQRRRCSWDRGVAARILGRYAGLTQREVAQVLGIGTGAAVSRQIHKLSEQLLQDRRLRRLVEQAESRLNELRNAKNRSASAI